MCHDCYAMLCYAMLCYASLTNLRSRLTPCIRILNTRERDKHTTSVQRRHALLRSLAGARGLSGSFHCAHSELAVTNHRAEPQDRSHKCGGRENLRSRRHSADLDHRSNDDAAGAHACAHDRGHEPILNPAHLLRAAPPLRCTQTSQRTTHRTQNLEVADRRACPVSPCLLCSVSSLSAVRLPVVCSRRSRYEFTSCALKAQFPHPQLERAPALSRPGHRCHQTSNRRCNSAQCRCLRRRLTLRSCGTKSPTDPPFRAKMRRWYGV